ncbi:MAG: DUF4202 domain-containing protein [Planctomycetota bacterium]
MDDAVYHAARAAIDDAHRADPAGKELAYADSVERWLERLIPNPSPGERLAARCQHLERWTLPRDSHPMDRAGYLQWRRAVHVRQGERAAELLAAAGVDAATCTVVEEAVAKKRAKEGLAQTLEDAACLVFLDEQAADFAAGYSEEKMIAIIQKTWRKMSPAGHELALALPLPAAVSTLVHKALA